MLLRLCRPKRWRMVARGLDGPVPSRCVDAHFHVLRGSNPRPGLFPPCANRVFETRSIALSRSSHSVWRRHSSHSLVVLLLHWYDASAALQRTSACCCGHDRWPSRFSRADRGPVARTRAGGPSWLAMSHHNIEDFKPLSVSPNFGVLARPSLAKTQQAGPSSGGGH